MISTTANTYTVADCTPDMAAGIHLLHARLSHRCSRGDGYGETWRDVSHWIVSCVYCHWLRKVWLTAAQPRSSTFRHGHVRILLLHLHPCGGLRDLVLNTVVLLRQSSISMLSVYVWA